MRRYAAAVAFLLSTGVVQAAETFEKVAIFLEQTIQDGDAEVKFEVIGRSAGLSAVRVTAPDGRLVVDFQAPASKFGLRHLTLETPEPIATLSHGFPAAAAITRPRADEGNVPVGGLRVTWAAVKDAASITVAIEDEKSGREVRATLPGSATGFTVPPDVLTGGTNYKLAVGTIAKSGNKTVSEIGFTTVGKK